MISSRPFVLKLIKKKYIYIMSKLEIYMLRNYSVFFIYILPALKL